MNDSEYPKASGWSSTFPTFREASAPYVRQSLLDFLKLASPEQIKAWDDSIPPLQDEIGQVIGRDPLAASYSTILEYELPMEQRRPDVILLMGGAVLVIELKGKRRPELSDLDQASAYARDLRAYHRDCETRDVTAALVLIQGKGRMGVSAGVEVLGPDALDDLAREINAASPGEPLDRSLFLQPEAYRPLPSLVEAARELMEHGELRRVRRAAAATGPTVDYLADVVHEAVRTKTRHLVLVSGLPGTGKTLVGLQLVHSRFLDDLAVVRSGGQPTAPAVYLSGNGPLVEVLQYELGSAGGGGRTFVRDVKAYVRRYASNTALPPSEHVLVFDEAQRAHDAAQVAVVHKAAVGLSEAEHFVEFAERIPEWCVVVGLLGSGQEIHVGEEGGVEQWRDAITRSPQAGTWIVHAPPAAEHHVSGVPRLRLDDRLHLVTELRYHLAGAVHSFVDGLLAGTAPSTLRAIAEELEREGYALRLSRDLETSRRHMKRRYDDDPNARFGMIASSRDRDLARFGVPNDWNSTKRLRYGPWFVEGDEDRLGRSCRELRECVTEFGCQGLELDGALLAWGTDFIRDAGVWDVSRSRTYQDPTRIHDGFQLRLNAYRVLLTRARDGVVVFVPPIHILDETYEYLKEAGFRDLEDFNSGEG